MRGKAHQLALPRLLCQVPLLRGGREALQELVEAPGLVLRPCSLWGSVLLPPPLLAEHVMVASERSREPSHGRMVAQGPRKAEPDSTTNCLDEESQPVDAPTQNSPPGEAGPLVIDFALLPEDSKIVCARVYLARRGCISECTSTHERLRPPKLKLQLVDARGDRSPGSCLPAEAF